MSDNLRIWNAVCKTDPAHTKGFKRSGGFTGTAIKPIWVERRLTEQFGPCGEGWGCDEPKFQVIPTEREVLVYCTVRAWHGNPANALWGVGGDKVVAVFKNGPVADDEAFKKAFTDALMNAFKHIGVGADVHMGLFDDSKYVAELEREFAPAEDRVDDMQIAILQTLAEQAGADMGAFCKFYRIGSLPELPASRFDHAKAQLEKKLNSKAAA